MTLAAADMRVSFDVGTTIDNMELAVEERFETWKNFHSKVCVMCARCHKMHYTTKQSLPASRVFCLCGGRSLTIFFCLVSLNVFFNLSIRFQLVW